jgi:hypothetical protein
MTVECRDTQLWPVFGCIPMSVYPEGGKPKRKTLVSSMDLARGEGSNVHQEDILDIIVHNREPS